MRQFLLVVGFTGLLLGCGNGNSNDGNPSSSSSSTSSSASTSSSSSSSSSSSNSSGSAGGTTDTLRYYVFGHSLYTWDYGGEPGSYPESSTGYWLASMADYAGLEAGGTGQYGQLDYHALPPGAQYGYTTNTFDPWPSGTFAEQNFTHVLVMPSNFEQTYLTPSEYMPRTRRVLDYILAQAPNTTIVLYEHWPETNLAGNVANGAALTAQEWDTYNSYTLGEYHQWFLEWQNLIVAAYPNANIKMVPIGPVITQLLENTSYLSSLSFTDLYADDAPHGTRTTYLLAAVIIYRALYGVNPSDTYIPSSTQVAPELVNNFANLLRDVETWLTYYDQNGVLVF